MSQEGLEQSQGETDPIVSALDGLSEYAFSSFHPYIVSPNPLLYSPDFGYLGLPISAAVNDQIAGKAEVLGSGVYNGTELPGLCVKSKGWQSWCATAFEKAVQPLGIDTEADTGTPAMTSSLESIRLFTRPTKQPVPIVEGLDGSKSRIGTAIVILPSLAEYSCRTTHSSLKEDFIIGDIDEASSTIVGAWYNGVNATFDLTKGHAVVLVYRLDYNFASESPRPNPGYDAQLEDLREALSSWLEQDQEKSPRILMWISHRGERGNKQFVSQAHHLCHVSETLRLKAYCAHLRLQGSGRFGPQNLVEFNRGERVLLSDRDDDNVSYQLTGWSDGPAQGAMIGAEIQYDFRSKVEILPHGELDTIYNKDIREVQNHSFDFLSDFDVVLLCPQQHHARALVSLFKLGAGAFLQKIPIEQQVRRQPMIRLTEGVIYELSTLLQGVNMQCSRHHIKTLLELSVYYSRPDLFERVTDMLGVKEWATAQILFAIGWPEAWKGVIRYFIDKNPSTRAKFNVVRKYLGDDEPTAGELIAELLAEGDRPPNLMVMKGLKETYEVEFVFSRVIPLLERFLPDTSYWLSVFPLLFTNQIALRSLVSAVVAAHRPGPGPQQKPPSRRPGRGALKSASQGSAQTLRPTQNRSWGSPPPQSQLATSTSLSPSRFKDITAPPANIASGAHKPEVTIRATMSLLRYCICNAFTEHVPALLTTLKSLVDDAVLHGQTPPSPPSPLDTVPETQWLWLIENVYEILEKEKVPAEAKPYEDFFQDVFLHKIARLLEDRELVDSEDRFVDDVNNVVELLGERLGQIGRLYEAAKARGGWTAVDSKLAEAWLKTCEGTEDVEVFPEPAVKVEDTKVKVGDVKVKLEGGRAGGVGGKGGLPGELSGGVRAGKTTNKKKRSPGEELSEGTKAGKVKKKKKMDASEELLGSSPTKRLFLATSSVDDELSS